jgi:RHS repeat-associated protein
MSRNMSARVRKQRVESDACTFTTCTFTYCNLLASPITSETTPQGTVAYTYDNAGRRATMTASGQPTTNYFYDDANRLTQISQGLSTVAFNYDASGRRTSLTLPNGVVVEYSYDTASRLTELKYKNGALDLGNLTYFYDKAGNRTKVGGSFARTGLPQAITTATYDNANRQTVFGGKTMVFDLNGNLTSITEGGSTTSHTWNSRNQLTAISVPGVSASFVYDGLGRREKKTINGSLTEFLYDGVNPVQETAGATVLANTLPGLGLDEFLSRTDVVAATTSHFLPDALGSALALADDTGTVQTEYTYEPFGRTTATGATDTNPLQYTSRENDGTGLYHYRARYYHPQLQRFVSEDPFNFSTLRLLRNGKPEMGFLTILLQQQPVLLNSYGYVGNNPLLYDDPLGLFFVPGAVIGAGIGAVGGIAGAMMQGGSFTDIVAAGGIGALTGGLIGGFPILGGPMAGAIIGGLSDVAGQLITGAGRKDFEFNYSSVIGSALGGLAGAGQGNYLANAIVRNGYGKASQAVIGSLGGLLPTALGSGYGNLIGQATGF